MSSKRAINLAALIIGLGALAFLVYKVGLGTLAENLVAAAPIFPLLLVVEALSTALSNIGWYYAFDPRTRPAYRRLLGISFASLSIAGALPTGQAGEVAKANLLRGVTPTTEIVSSLLIYNYLHILSVMLTVVVGPIAALVIGAGFEARVVWICLGAAFLALAVTFALGALLYSGILHRLLLWIRNHRLVWKPSAKLEASVREVDGKLRDIIAVRPADITRGAFALVAGRAMRVVEIHIILVFSGVSDSITVSLMVFSTTAMVNYLLMILPAREGFLEGSTYVVFRLLGLSGAHGLSLEIIRRLRKIFFQITGVALMMHFVRAADPADAMPTNAANEGPPTERSDP